MTSTTETTIKRVYVRNRGYAQLLGINADHSAMVSYEPSSSHDGCDHPSAEGTERVPFGDWLYEPTGENETIGTIKVRLESVLKRDLGESFHVASQGVGPGLAAWLTAWYGPFEVEITIMPRDLGPMTPVRPRRRLRRGDDRPAIPARQQRAGRRPGQAVITCNAFKALTCNDGHQRPSGAVISDHLSPPAVRVSAGR
jgi:hypothetical protein